MTKRKRSTKAEAELVVKKETPVPLPNGLSKRSLRQPRPAKVEPNPDQNPDILDAQEALRASPDSVSSLSDVPSEQLQTASTPVKKAVVSRAGTAAKTAKAQKRSAADEIADPEADDPEGEAVEDIQAAALRPPAVNSSYLPLPWKGRLGYVCITDLGAEDVR
jgi:UV DNA damage endonuclease